MSEIVYEVCMLYSNDGVPVPPLIVRAEIINWRGDNCDYYASGCYVVLF